MRLNKRFFVSAMTLMCLLAAGALSKPGRLMLGRVGVAFETGELGTLWSEVKPEAAAAFASDVEQRARARHGWRSTVLNSLARGVITSYDRSGAVTRRIGLTVYRSYPDHVRVELGFGMPLEVLGFDGQEAWKAGAGALTRHEARDIRAWLRGCPERLFINRSAGANYREAGRRVEDYKPATPWAGATQQVPTTLEQVELEDIIGAVATPRRLSADRRFVEYYIDRDNSVVASARWLEPQDPTQLPDDPNRSSLDVRIDFDTWTHVGGVLWPMRVTHWLGGKVDFRIDFEQVLVNQQMPDTMFQRP